MNELAVVMGSSVPPGPPSLTLTMQLYLDQLRAAGIESHIYTLRDIPTEGGIPWPLWYYIKCYREIVNEFQRYERLIITNAWDVTFYGNREDVIRKIPMDLCLVGAGRESWPDCSLRDRTPGDTPWKFSNGGLTAGTPENILKMVDALEKHPRYEPGMWDQGMLNIVLAYGPKLFHLDSRTELFFCLFDGYSELDFERGMPVNTLCGTRPCFIHANGRWDTTELYEKRERSLR